MYCCWGSSRGWKVSTKQKDPARKWQFSFISSSVKHMCVKFWRSIRLLMSCHDARGNQVKCVYCMKGSIYASFIAYYLVYIYVNKKTQRILCDVWRGTTFLWNYFSLHTNLLVLTQGGHDLTTWTERDQVWHECLVNQ